MSTRPVTVRLQPVAPEPKPMNVIVIRLLAGIAVTFLWAAIVMLGASAARTYWPGVPPLGYWNTWLMLLALSVIAHVTIGRLQWRWARL